MRMHNGLEIKPDEQQQLIQHSRAVTDPLPEEINPVATAIQHEAVLSAAPVTLLQEARHSATEPIEVLENSSVSSSAEDEESGQQEPERVFNHQGTPPSSRPCLPGFQPLDPCSAPTDRTGMIENSNAYRRWKPKPLEGKPVTPQEFRDKLAELSQQLSMPVQQEKPRVSETSEIEDLNLWLADPLLRKEVMPRVMKGDRNNL
ncbi:MAG: hypothetical protein ACRDEA_02425 [Microcystaceae cyanobacterium]